MGHKSFITRLVELVELYEIEYPDDLDSEKIAKYNTMIADGADLEDLPENVSFEVVSSLELEGERMGEWEQESEYMPVVEDMITTIRDYNYNLEQFLWHLECIPNEEFFKFIIYLHLNGYFGDEDDMFKQFHKDHCTK